MSSENKGESQGRVSPSGSLSSSATLTGPSNGTKSTDSKNGGRTSPVNVTNSPPEKIEKVQSSPVQNQLSHSSDNLGKSPPSENGGFRSLSQSDHPKSSKEEKKKIKKIPSGDEYYPSVFKDHDFREKLCDYLPLLKVRKMKKSLKVLESIMGPYEVNFTSDPFLPWVCGKSISTYPHLPAKPIRDGDPICDSYCVQMLEDNIVLCVVADGCNWGQRPMEASNRARDALVEYLRTHLVDITNLREAGQTLLNALSYCHHKILEGKEDLWEAGTTTLLGGIMCRLKDSSNGDKWAWVSVSIGDCKSFHYQTAKGEVTDLTEGNRKNIYDARDPGGRLGPYVGEGEPDLRNVFVYHRICDEGDLIILLSDGVHDNLDPQTLGKTPKDVSAAYAQYKDWKDFPTEAEALKAKTEYMRKFLVNELINGGEEEKRLRMKVFSHPMVDEDMLSPSNITTRVMKHCLDVTASGREWMEQNPKDKLPNDYSAYPGKMDHATCVVVKVGKFDTALTKASSKEKDKMKARSLGTEKSKLSNSKN